ncbi:Chaperone protein DnaK [bioreactor metagenome]|uniref:Chaperone protein DnaK n=1 Tax=bioreactor metagenome TaxID=1076179 RepID=A0A645JBB0_9ZZZZ
MGSKVQPAEKEQIEKAKEELKTALGGNDTEEIKAKSEALSKALYAVTERIYKETGAQNQQGAGAGQAPGQGGDDTVVDADYTVVDDDEKK